MKNEDFVIKETKNNDVAKFTVKGRINTNNASEFKDKLEKSINDGSLNIVVNMSKVEYLSSSGIRVILQIYKQLDELKGNFSIERPSENVKNVLGMVALDKMLII